MTDPSAASQVLGFAGFLTATAFVASANYLWRARHATRNRRPRVASAPTRGRHTTRRGTP